MALKTIFSPLTVEDIPALAAERKADGWRFVQLLCVNTEDGIDMIYSFMKDGLLENCEIRGVRKGTVIPSITDKFIEAFVFENESHDLFGVDIQGIAIDFGGNFYTLAQKEPMTIISPEQKAARDKAAKIAAAKAEKEKKAAAANAAFCEGHPDAAPAKMKDVVVPSGDDDAELKLVGADPEKVARARAAIAAKAKKASVGAAPAARERDAEIDQKIAGLDPMEAAKVRAAMEAKAAREESPTAVSERPGE